MGGMGGWLWACDQRNLPVAKIGLAVGARKISFLQLLYTVANYDQVTGYPYGIPTTIVVVFVFPCLLLFDGKKWHQSTLPKLFVATQARWLASRVAKDLLAMFSDGIWQLTSSIWHKYKSFGHVYSVFWQAFKSGSILYCVTEDFTKFSLTFKKISTWKKCLQLGV